MKIIIESKKAENSDFLFAIYPEGQGNNARMTGDVTEVPRLTMEALAETAITSKATGSVSSLRQRCLNYIADYLNELADSMECICDDALRMQYDSRIEDAKRFYEELAQCSDPELVLPTGTTPPGFIEVAIAGGRTLYAQNKNDAEYPGIAIYLLEKGEKVGGGTLIAWAEYNTVRQDYTDEHRLRIMAWDASHDEPVVNLGYYSGEFEHDDVLNDDGLSCCKHCGGKARMTGEQDQDGTPYFYVECLKCGVRTKKYYSQPKMQTGQVLARRAWNKIFRL